MCRVVTVDESRVVRAHSCRNVTVAGFDSEPYAVNSVYVFSARCAS